MSFDLFVSCQWTSNERVAWKNRWSSSISVWTMVVCHDHSSMTVLSIEINAFRSSSHTRQTVAYDNIYIYVYVFIKVYIYIYIQTFYTGQQWNVHQTAVVTCDIYRLFFSNDPRHVSPTVCTRSSRTGHWIKGTLVHIRAFPVTREPFLFNDVLWSNYGLFYVVYLCHETCCNDCNSSKFIYQFFNQDDFEYLSTPTGINNTERGN